MLVLPCSQFSAILLLAVSSAIPTKKILFCVSDFILSLLRAARVLLLCTICIVSFIFSHILALSLDFSGMTLLLVTIEPIPKTVYNVGLCLLPYMLQLSIVLLENSLHCANISRNLPYCSLSVIPANSTDKCYLQKFGTGSKSSLPINVCLS